MCFAYGRVGHRSDGCPLVICGPKEVYTTQQLEGRGKESRVVMHESIVEDGYGSWMVVKRKNTSPKQMKSVEPTLVSGTGSPSSVNPTRTSIGKSEAHTPVGGPIISFNGNNVGHKGNKENTSGCNIAGSQIESKETTVNNHMGLEACVQTKPKDKMTSELSYPPRKGLTKHGRDRSFRPKKEKKEIKILSQGVAHPKSKQTFTKSLSVGRYGRT